jgi:HPt (histidine-containing phosphotransfer) domain-containing protein
MTNGGTLTELLDLERLQSLLDTLGPVVMGTLVQKLRDESEQMQRDCRDAAASGEGESLRHALHHINGMMGNLAARRCYDLGQRLEGYCLDGHVADAVAGVPEYLDVMDQSIEALGAAIKAAI